MNNTVNKIQWSLVISNADITKCPRALDKREYLMIFFLISHRNHML